MNEIEGYLLLNKDIVSITDNIAKIKNLEMRWLFIENVLDKMYIIKRAYVKEVRDEVKKSQKSAVKFAKGGKDDNFFSKRVRG